MSKLIVMEPGDLRAIVAEELREVLRQELRGAGRGLARGDLISTTEAADLAAVTPETIRKWMDAGKLRRHNAGRVRRVSRRELQAFLGREQSSALRSPEQAADELLRRRSARGHRNEPDQDEQP